MEHEPLLTAAPTSDIISPLDARDSHATRYKAKVDGVSPRAARESVDQREQCFFGVSLENDKFSRTKLYGLVEWISRRFRRCTVLVGDSIHRITLETTRGLDSETALDEALRLGGAFVESARPVFDAFAATTDFTFLTCAEVQTWDAYRAHHETLRALFREDAAFRDSVEHFGRQYHGKHSLDVSEEERERRIARSSEYFLEEFAIFACLQERGLDLMVYPGSFSSLAEIAEGEHPMAPEPLRKLVVVSLLLRGTRK